MSQEQLTTTAVLDRTLRWSADQGYLGWNKHDGLNSPILQALLGWGKWPRLVAIQGVMRFPMNLRPWLLVPKVYNPKGLALFVQAWLDRYRLEGDAAHLAQAERLLDLLLAIRSPGTWGGNCWGYRYPWQDPGFFAPTDTPNAVVTSFVCEAFLDVYRVTGNPAYLDTVGSALGFFFRDLRVLKDEAEELCLGYMPTPMTMRVMDVSILIGAVAAQYGALAAVDRYRRDAYRLAHYVVRRQTEEGAWFYTDPPGDSHIRHDNYHTGFILDALWRYMEAAGDRQWESAYWQGLEFYAERLFNSDGSPRWMSHMDYPHDIHGAAQGILTFARHDGHFPGLARRITEWAIANMYHPEGRFYYQQTRLIVKRFTLMRWCNAWMARSLARYCRTVATSLPSDAHSRGASEYGGLDIASTEPQNRTND